MDVAGGAGDGEGVGLAGVEGEVKLGSKVGDEAVEEGFGRRRGLGGSCGGESQEDRGAD